MRSTISRFLVSSIVLIAFAFVAHAQNPNAPHIFCSNRDGDYEIYLYDASGTLTNLTDNAVDDITPTLAPDGKRIAFTRDTDGDGAYQIFVLDLATRAVKQLTTGEFDYAIYPSWSPDSTRLAYTNIDVLAALFGSNNVSDIRVVTAPFDNAAPQIINVTTEAPDQVAPAWSADGTRIAYMQGSLLAPENNPFKIFTVAVNQSGTRTAAPVQQTFGTALDITPAWSPDSSQLVFSSNAQDGNFELYLLTPRADGNGNQAVPSRLTTFALDDVLPAFSRDGSTIVFTNGDAAQYIETGIDTPNPPPGDNYIISVTGGTPIALATNAATDDNDAELLPSTSTRRVRRNLPRRVRRSN